jgi:hypothetical protein
MPSTHIGHWIAQQNVERYKRLLAEAPSEQIREQLQQLLTEAETHMASLQARAVSSTKRDNKPE